MRAFVQRPFAVVFLICAAGLSGRAMAQADAAAQPEADITDQVTVRGQKSLSEYRFELEQARNEIFRRFNEANRGSDTDITCKKERPTGSRMRQSVCRSNAENASDAAAAQGFLLSLLHSTGNFTQTGVASGGDIAGDVGSNNAQKDGESGEADALAKYEAEWRRILAEDQDLFQTVLRYVELEAEYDRARGAAIAPIASVPVATNVGQPSGPKCEASTLTEYYQRGAVAHVSGTVSLASCPAGTTGGFTLTARVRDESGETKSIEFNEEWQRAEPGDYKFDADYPIGDDVELMNVRVRGLKCTCNAAAQP